MMNAIPAVTAVGGEISITPVGILLWYCLIDYNTQKMVKTEENKTEVLKTVLRSINYD
jgi:hypothetical protein